MVPRRWPGGAAISVAVAERSPPALCSLLLFSPFMSPASPHTALHLRLLPERVGRGRQWEPSLHRGKWRLSWWPKLRSPRLPSPPR